MSRTSEAIYQINCLFDDSDKQFTADGSVVFSGLKQKIEFEGVSFGYGSIRILRQVNFTAEKGKMTAIVGPTGSGKTTLVHMILMFYDALEGRILLDGVPIRDFELKSLRKKIALVSQNIEIMNTTIRANIVYGLEKAVTEAELDAVTKKAYLYDFVKNLPKGYDTWVGEKGVKLSGGEKQRVAIARALLKNPDIFIFDEATSSLDMETELSIQKAIEDLTAGKTVVVIAHRLSTIRNADHIVVLEKGKVVEEGKFSDLISQKGKFHYYWSFQSIDY